MWQTISYMNKMKIRQAKANDGAVDWGTIKKHALRAPPPYPEDVDHYAAFLMVNGSEQGVEEMCHFARKHIRLDVPGALFKAVAEMKLAPHELVPRFANLQNVSKI